MGQGASEPGLTCASWAADDQVQAVVQLESRILIANGVFTNRSFKKTHQGLHATSSHFQQVWARHLNGADWNNSDNRPVDINTQTYDGIALRDVIVSVNATCGHYQPDGEVCLKYVEETQWIRETLKKTFRFGYRDEPEHSPRISPLNMGMTTRQARTYSQGRQRLARNASNASVTNCGFSRLEMCPASGTHW